MNKDSKRCYCTSNIAFMFCPTHGLAASPNQTDEVKEPCRVILSEQDGFGKFKNPPNPSKIIARCSNSKPCPIHGAPSPTDVWEEEIRVLLGSSNPRDKELIVAKIHALIASEREITYALSSILQAIKSKEI